MKVMAITRIVCLTALFACPGAVFGSPAACPTSSGTSLTSLSAGCTDVDIEFDNFSATAGGVNNDPNVPGTGDVDMYGGGAAGAVLANFDTPGANNWSVPTANTTEQLDSVLDFSVTTTNGNVIDQLAIPLTTSDFSGAASEPLTITEYYCLGQTTYSGCPGANSGSFGLEVIGNTINYNQSPWPVTASTTIAVQIEIVAQYGETLSTLPLEFDEVAPEPGSLILLATGLAALLLFGRRAAAAKS